MHLSRHISGTVKHIIMIFGTLVLNDNISRVLFHFLHIFIFWAVMEVKGQEMAQNAKKKCLLHFMYQEPYILWLSFIVDFCKMMISPGFFFSFFWSLEKWKITITSVTCHISGTLQHIIKIFGTLVLNDDISGVLYHFLKFLFFRLLGW